MMDGWVILADHNYAIHFAMDGELILDFRVYAAALGGKIGEEMTWGLYDGQNAFEFEDHEKAFWEISGGLKWDGCINWETNPECMVHGCSPRHADEIAAIFQTVYHIGKRHMDLLGDDAPPLPANAIERFPTRSTLV